jgi:hypothetical protein
MYIFIYAYIYIVYEVGNAGAEEEEGRREKYQAAPDPKVLPSLPSCRLCSPSLLSSLPFFMEHCPSLPPSLPPSHPYQALLGQSRFPFEANVVEHADTFFLRLLVQPRQEAALGGKEVGREGGREGGWGWEEGAPHRNPDLSQQLTRGSEVAHPDTEAIAPQH